MFANLFTRRPTLGEITREWLACKRPDLSPDWHRECTRLLERDLLPVLGTRRSPSRRDIATALEPLPRGVRRNAHTVLSSAFGWAVETGRLDANPMAGLRRPAAPSRERVLSLPELRAVWQATDDGHDFSRIVRLLALTACRRDEIGDLGWVEIEGDRLALPAQRVKNGRGQLVPLCPLALDCLPRRRPGWPLVFGRRKARGFSGWSRCKERLDARCGVTGWVLHDLRRSFATHAVELGLADPDLVELALGHCRPGIRGVYNRFVRWPERIALAGRWSEVVRGVGR